MRGFLRKFIDDMADAQNHVTGYVPHTAPFGGGGGGPAWGSAYVIAPHAYFRHYGDTALLREHYAGMKAWVDYLGTRTDSRGLVVREEPGGWCLGEWCTLHNAVEIPAELVNTAYYHRMASLMAETAAITGNDADCQHFIALANRIRLDFNREFLNPATGHYWQGRQGSDAIVLGCGLVPDSLRQHVIRAMVNHIDSLDRHFDTGIIGTPLTLDVLADNGYAEVAFDLLTARGTPSFDYVLSPANSTLWETWNGDGDDGGRGHCHPMFGSVVTWLHSRLAGIRPDGFTNGTQRFTIAPTPVSKLQFCEATYTTPQGTVTSHWENLPDGRLRLAVNIPRGIEADVVIPQWNHTPSRTITHLSPGLHVFHAGGE